MKEITIEISEDLYEALEYLSENTKGTINFKESILLPTYGRTLESLERVAFIKSSQGENIEFLEDKIQVLKKSCLKSWENFYINVQTL